MDRQDCFVSVVAPLLNEAASASSYIDEVMAVLRSRYVDYELVLVNDGSTDATVAEVSALLRRHQCIRLITLSRHFGVDIAISAGLEAAIGDFVVVMRPDSDPPDKIPEMVDLARAGNGVVTGITENRLGETLATRWLAPFFYRLCRRVLGLNLHEHATDFRVFSRQAVNAMVQIKDKNRYLRLLAASIGYSAATYSYREIQRVGRPRRKRLLGVLRQVTSLVVAGSIHPLRFVSWLGAAGGLLNLAYVGYIIAVHFIKNRVAEGWTTLSLQITGMFFLVFLILIVLCEYVGRVLEESRDRPLYHVIDERTSSVLLTDPDRLNVHDSSTTRGTGPRRTG